MNLKRLLVLVNGGFDRAAVEVRRLGLDDPNLYWRMRQAGMFDPSTQEDDAERFAA